MIMKRLSLLCMLMSFGLLTGCAVKSPAGTVNIQYDASEKSDDVRFISDSGKEYKVNMDEAESISKKLISSLELPEGVTEEDVEKMVTDTLESMGIEQDDIKDNVKDVTKQLKKALEEEGIDTKDVNINEILEEAE